MKRQLRILLTVHGEFWHAQCLEHDISGSGRGLHEAMDALKQSLISAYAFAADEGKDNIDDIPPAPDHVWREYDEAAELTSAKLEIFRFTIFSESDGNVDEVITQHVKLAA